MSFPASARIVANPCLPPCGNMLRQAADTRGVSGNIERRVSKLWEGRIGPDAATTTSLKSAAATVEAGPSVVIRPRVIRDESEIAESQADYEVQGQLGQGGMGVVLAARQASINRTVAVKMLVAAKGRR